MILGWESFVQGMDKDYYRQFRMGYDYYGLDQKTRVLGWGAKFGSDDFELKGHLLSMVV